VASTALYGGSQNLLHYTLRRFSIDTSFVKPGGPRRWLPSPKLAILPNPPGLARLGFVGCGLAQDWASGTPERLRLRADRLKPVVRALIGIR
jgi:hypothetical protein